MSRSKELVEKWAARGAISKESAKKFGELIQAERGEAARAALKAERLKEERRETEARARAEAERRAAALLDEQYAIEERTRETGERWMPATEHRPGVWVRKGENVNQALRREREAVEVESDDPTAPTVAEVNGTRRILRGCFICGQANVQRLYGLVGFTTLGRLSGYLCRACRKVWDTTTLSTLEVVKRRLKAERRPTTNPANAIWGLRLAALDLELAELQVPVSKPFGFLAAPQQLPPALAEGSEEE